MSKRGGDFVIKYEVMFIAKPLEEAEVDPIVELVSNLLTKNGCTIEKVDRWGKRHLAYHVKKQADGYYVLINFEANLTSSKKSTVSSRSTILF